MKKVARLTDARVRQAAPGDKPYNLYDSGGLYLTVSPTGSKWWRLKYRHAGKERRIGLGAYPEVSLSNARDARDKARMAIRAGNDPGLLKRAESARLKVSAANSFEAVAREWLAMKKSGWVASQFEKERRRLEIHAFPWIGKTPIADLGTAEIRPLLDRLVRRGTLDMAHRLRQQISAVFRYAGRDDRVSRDPAGNLAGTLPEHSKRSYATLTDPDDVAALLRAIDGFKGQFPTACALRLAPLFFVRPGELRGAEWAEVDFASSEWRIPAMRRKLKKKLKEDPQTPSHVVPLARQAVKILRELHALTGHGKYLFPGVRDPKRPMSNATINAALCRLGYDGETMTGHGFRHMASTLLNELGWNPDAIERQLAHKGQGVRAVYNKAAYMEERRKMMQAWADHLDTLRALPLPLKRCA
ncbi:integrase arm-type DNA-binding domain-containing protein [Dyella sp.]|uniref:tyrosine-type recombinase/integrase n=1 Tax=Dyella sp. TaxID=1869338 RepID=UPI002BD81F0C|nr:integrase arm-type DNA-binding domain-containing protein [Rhodanobacteraceae bacterium]